MADSLTFYLNGERVSLAAGEVDPEMSLNEFIRTQTRFTGTKLGCGEGGCGACTVVAARWDDAASKEECGSVNSCLMPLCAVDGYAITTTEGIGSSNAGCGGNGPHPVQQRIAGFNGTQCGYCTPGMVMTLYSTLRGAGGGANLTMADIESKFDGNICRCTGYRPILDAAKSFAADSTITDGVSGGTPTGPVDTSDVDPAFPEELKGYARQAQTLGSGTTWLRPVTLAGTLAILGSPCEGSRKVVFGNTSSGIYKHERVTEFVSVRDVAELRIDETTAAADGGVALVIGAAHTISHLFARLDELAADKPAAAEVLAFMRARVANEHVRATGSWAGNLVLARARGFASDLAPSLLALGATLRLATPAEGVQEASVAEFLARGRDGEAWDGSTLVVSATIPLPEAGTAIRGYKGATRPVNSHAHANLVARAAVAGGRVTSATLASSGLADSGVIELPATAAALCSAELGPGLVAAVMAAAEGELAAVTGDGNHGSAAYRARLASGFVFKFALSLLADAGVPLGGAASAPLSISSEGRPVSGGSQAFDAPDASLAPVNQPLNKISGLPQACGDALYTADIGHSPATLHAAFLLSTRANSGLRSVDISRVRAARGVVAVLRAEDVPGENDVSVIPMEKIPLFATDAVKMYGTPVGLVVADSARHAEEAARLVDIEYDMEGKFAAPLLSVAASKGAAAAMAAAGATMTTEMPIGHTATRGDAAAAFAERDDLTVVEGTLNLGTQQHFYMECQAARAAPAEGGRLDISCASQWPSGVHAVVCKVLAQPFNKVKYTTRRAGGAFGGKMGRAVHVASAVAVAARVLNRPVSMMLPRTVDQVMVGGRHEYETSYRAGIAPDGTVAALEVDCDIGCGDGLDLSFFMASALLNALEQYYIENLRATTRCFFTHHATRTTVRGPAEVQGSAIIETVMAHAAAATGLPLAAVQEANHFPADQPEKLVGASHDGGAGSPVTHYTLQDMWRDVKNECGFDARVAAADEFNANNRWKKRGVALAPVKYHVGGMKHFATLNVYLDGTVGVRSGGSEMGQGLNTKVVQTAARVLSAIVPGDGVVPVGDIVIEDIDTTVIPNMTFTGGSQGSEVVCGAILECGKAMAELLAPVIAQLTEAAEAKAAESKEGDGDGAAAPVTWQQICRVAAGGPQGFGGGLNLSVTRGWKAEDPTGYFNYGVAMSEVEVDVLTGDTRILRTDLKYDCGKSLNQAIDMGQAEGAFMMGVGFYLREKMLYGPDGAVLSDGTWEYKPPAAVDVPLEFNVTFHENRTFDKGVMSSKSSGEPPLVLSTSVFQALRCAIAAARKDAGLEGFFPLHAPVMVEDVLQACGGAPLQLDA